jgi:glutaredoxin-like protein NrdH
MQIRVYSKPDCVQCDTTKRYMDKHGIRYESVDLTQDPISMDMVTSLGYTQVPVVYLESKLLGVKHWSGFRAGDLAGLVQHFNREQRDTPTTN